MATAGYVRRTGDWGLTQTPITDAAGPTTDCTLGQIFTLSTNSARTMAAPTNGRTGTVIIYEFLNNGGTGAITWNAIFKLAGAWVDPANAKRRSISFWFNGTNWNELWRTAADV